MFNSVVFFLCMIFLCVSSSVFLSFFILYFIFVSSFLPSFILHSHLGGISFLCCHKPNMCCSFSSSSRFHFTKYRQLLNNFYVFVATERERLKPAPPTKPLTLPSTQYDGRSIYRGESFLSYFFNRPFQGYHVWPSYHISSKPLILLYLSLFVCIYLSKMSYCSHRTRKFFQVLLSKLSIISTFNFLVNFKYV